MYNFSVTRETYNSIIIWLEILEEYDDSFQRMRIVDFKSRRIQQKAYNPLEVATHDVPKAFIQITNNSFTNNSIDNKTSKDLQSIELENITAYNLSSFVEEIDEFEELSEKINYFTNENESTIDFLK